MDENFFKDARLQRNQIAAAMQKNIDAVVKRRFESLAQESQITSRIAERLESSLDNFRTDNFQVKISTQELPDRGPVPHSRRAVHERKVGADLYIVVELVAHGTRVSKGILIQAKKRKAHWNQSDCKALVPQCEKMLENSASSYVWEYSNSGVRVVNAKEVLENPTKNPHHLNGYDTNLFFQDVLACNEGDQEIGFGGMYASNHQMRKMLEEFSAQTGVRMQINKSWPDYLEYR